MFSRPFLAGVATVLLAFVLLTGSAVAHSSSSRSSSSSSINASCAITAVDKRDHAMLTAFSVYSSSVINAITARMNALKSDWGIPDAAQRKAAIKDVWQTYRDTVKSVRATLKTARKNAWKQFSADMKACKVSIPFDESNGQSTDGQL